MKVKKTNAMRQLDTHKIDYVPHDLKLSEAADAQTVAHLLNTTEEQVFKTLVTVGQDKEHYVFMLPANAHLSLKKAARAAGTKKIEMIAQKELFPLTGYVHGGCSPLGMKKKFATFIDQSALSHDPIFFSGGQIGVQIEMNPNDLIETFQVKPADLCED